MSDGRPAAGAPQGNRGSSGEHQAAEQRAAFADADHRQLYPSGVPGTELAPPGMCVSTWDVCMSLLWDCLYQGRVCVCTVCVSTRGVCVSTRDVCVCWGMSVCSVAVPTSECECVYLLVCIHICVCVFTFTWCVCGLNDACVLCTGDD